MVMDKKQSLRVVGAKTWAVINKKREPGWVVAQVSDGNESVMLAFTVDAAMRFSEMLRRKAWLTMFPEEANRDG